MPVVKKAIKTVYLDTIPHVVKPFEFPALGSIKVSDLPNNGFGNKNYYIPKTKFGHWPVYLRIQNTKITTEIKRLKGDLTQFKADLLESVPGLDARHISVNEQTGNVNVKGDLVDILKEVFTQKVKNEK